MAEFGIKATELADPQGRGSAPIAPVQEPASNWSLPNLGGLFTGLTGKEKPWSSTINEYYKKANAIQETILTGDTDPRRGYNQLKMLTSQYNLKVADFGPEAHKAMSDSFKMIQSGGVGLDEVQEINKADAQRTIDATSSLQKMGVYVPPVAEQSQAERDFIVRQEAHINNLTRIGEQTQKDIAFRNSVDAASRATQEFTWKMQDRARSEDARNSLSAMKRDAIGYIPTLIESINNRSDLDMAGKQILFEQSMLGLSRTASEQLGGDPATFQDYNRSIEELTKIGRGLFDTTGDNSKLKNELERRILTEQLRMTDNQPVLRSAAIDRLMPNSPAIQMLTAQASSRILQDDIHKAISASVVPSIVANDIPTQKATFQTIQGTINRFKSGESDNPQADLDAAAKAASSTLKTMGMVNTNSNVTLEYTKDFLASTEYAELIKNGKYDPDAAAQAQPVFQDLYVAAFGEQFFNKIGQPIGDINYKDGKPDPNGATLGRIMDFDVSADGTIKAVKKIAPDMKVTASNLYIDRQIREAQKMADGLTKVVRASAHLEGRTDYAKYWEENKHYLARGIYPPPEYIEKLKAQGYIGTGSALNPANYARNNQTGSSKGTTPTSK